MQNTERYSFLSLFCALFSATSEPFAYALMLSHTSKLQICTLQLSALLCHIHVKIHDSLKESSLWTTHVSNRKEEEEKDRGGRTLFFFHWIKRVQFQA
jgi:hypothetical protein